MLRKYRLSFCDTRPRPPAPPPGRDAPSPVRRRHSIPAGTRFAVGAEDRPLRSQSGPLERAPTRCPAPVRHLYPCPRAPYPGTASPPLWRGTGGGKRSERPVKPRRTADPFIHARGPDGAQVMQAPPIGGRARRHRSGCRRHRKTGRGAVTGTGPRYPPEGVVVWVYSWFSSHDRRLATVMPSRISSRSSQIAFVVMSTPL